MSNHDRDPERFARRSFSMRPAAKWQVWAMTGAAIIVILALIAAVAG